MIMESAQAIMQFSNRLRSLLCKRPSAAAKASRGVHFNFEDVAIAGRSPMAVKARWASYHVREGG